MNGGGDVQEASAPNRQYAAEFKVETVSSDRAGKLYGADPSQIITVDTKVKVYFLDLQSSWRRGTNENSNGLLRQNLPKGTDRSLHSQRDLNKIAL